jgi:hypothetical protein
MINDMQGRIIRSFTNQLRVKMHPYAQLKWFCTQPLDEPTNLASCEMLHFLSNSLETLKRQLATKIFNSICVSVAKEFNRLFFEDVIFKNTFNEEGARMLNRDIKTNLCSLFGNYIRKPAPLFAEIIEATTLLGLQQGTALLLRENIGTADEESCLTDLGIEVLEPEMALSIVKKRLFL